MKQIKYIFLMCIFLLALNLIGCSKNDMSNAAKILPPKNNNMPLDGVWVTDRYYTGTSSTMDNKEIKDKIGKIVSFNKNKVILYKDSCESPKYKIKTVDAQNYFMGNYLVNPESIGIAKNKVQIVSISSNENFFASFIILEEDKIMTYSNGVFFHMTKNSQLTSADTNLNKALNRAETTDDETGKHSKIIKNNNKSFSDSEILQQFSSGILLGLKSYKPVSYKLPYSFSKAPVKEPVYRSLWINFTGDSVVSVNDLPFILAPRQNGFWKINTNREVTQTYVKDYIFAYPIEKAVEFKPNHTSISKDEQFHSLADILFVGSDYISLELSGGGYKKGSQYTYKYNLLQVQPLDTLEMKTTTSISIGKIIGVQGIKALKQGAATYLNSLNYEEKQKLESFPRSDSFGLARENGKWILKGRLNYSSEAYKDSYGDFNIPIIASKELVTYDSLYPTWNVIKERVPEAVDAYSPPNKNFVMVLTKSSILIYDIINEELSKKPLKTISLKDEETVVMSHWATGKYVKTWDEQIKSLITK
ncbi:hypothetical protein [Clostridium sp. ZS2-4]|uniref:hypothetical protein n=1 Tax=Clostridium sp. ZS2-4 TaxID=2987703 RepID=UPI00227A456C|nr:hypothetical protein [Clostridium sp. ZS2-4]MCY6355713.1 hypothetical protein [Clostridium sp. ZS2-4]